jgi:uncharacterized protein HemX
MEAATLQLISALAGAVGTGYSIYSGQQQAKTQKNASAQAEAKAAANAKAADEATNRANQKKPNTAAILDQMLMAGRTGTSGTMLTGAAGIDPTQLSLGRSTLLGG